MSTKRKESYHERAQRRFSSPEVAANFALAGLMDGWTAEQREIAVKQVAEVIREVAAQTANGFARLEERFRACSAAADSEVSRYSFKICALELRAEIRARNGS